MSASVYFFRGAQYVRYDVLDDRVADGYPLAVGDQWAGLRDLGFDVGIDAVVDWYNGKLYFFKDSRYVRYDVAGDRVDDGFPLSIADQWPGMAAAGFGTGIDAAVNWQNGKAYFFKGGQYVRYDLAADRVDDGYPLSIGDQWPGMHTAGFDGLVQAVTTLVGTGRAPVLTGDLTDRFFASLRTMCAELGCHPARMLAVMNSESDVRASALHPSGVAAGINQLTTQTLPGVGWSQGPAAFAALTAEQQLPFVRRFFLPHRAAGLDSVGRLYQVNFMPATVQADQGPETVLAARGGVNAAAYQENAILDADHDGKITIGDLTATALAKRGTPRFAEIEGRL
jgi:hypothetical protein